MKAVKSIVPDGKSGNWAVERFEVPKHSLEAIRLAFQGRPIAPGEYTRLRRGGCVIMSDTPAEIRDLAPLRWKLEKPAAKSVLINGLGLGIAVQIALSYRHVRHVDVVENSRDVVALVAGHIVDRRLKIHCADALTVEWPKQARWDIVWHDIWDNIPNSDDRPTITKLKRKYGRKCVWQGVWAEHESRY